MFDEEMIHGERLERRSIGSSSVVSARLRLPWYRSLPFSCIEGVEVELDDRPIPPERLALRTNGHVHPIAELASLDEVEWFVLDAVDLELTGEPEFAPGAHALSVGLRMRIPYGDKDFAPLEFVQTARCSKTLELVEGDA